jgi:hypothetical protein
MHPILRNLALFLATAAFAVSGTALAQGKGQEKGKGPPDGKEKKAKQHKHQNGKNLVADKVKKNGKHEFHKHGKHTAFVDVQDGKIRGVNVKHAEKGDVPVKKYKTNKKMADASAGGIMPVNLLLVQAQSLGTTWIGYAYIDEWGDEVIYWFPYEMIYDGDTGAVDYVPIY